MKAKQNKADRSGLTVFEVLMVIILAVIAVGVILPMFARPTNRSSRIRCVNNLKQVALSFRIYANDNNDLYPMQIADDKGGAKDSIARTEVFRVFLAMSNELSVPKTVVCPNDSQIAATSWDVFGKTNISYFVGLDAENGRTNMILSGDRDIAEQGQLLSGTANLTTNRPVAWHKLLHKEGGNIALADGSVQQTTTATLRQLLANTGDTTNRVLFPQ